MKAMENIITKKIQELMALRENVHANVTLSTDQLNLALGLCVPKIQEICREMHKAERNHDSESTDQSYKELGDLVSFFVNNT